MAVEKGNKPLLDALNASLSTLKTNGELEKIAKKWGVSDLLTK